MSAGDGPSGDFPLDGLCQVDRSEICKLLPSFATAQVLQVNGSFYGTAYLPWSEPKPKLGRSYSSVRAPWGVRILVPSRTGLEDFLVVLGLWTPEVGLADIRSCTVGSLGVGETATFASCSGQSSQSNFSN